MPFIKISGLTTATAVSATNQFEINQNGASRSATLGQIASVITPAAISAVPVGPVTSSGLTMATSRLLGRTTAGSGSVEEISVGSGLSLTGGALTANITPPQFQTQLFTSSATWVVPAGVTQVRATVIGGGGGGGGSNNNQRAGNGGVGGFAVGSYTVTPGSSITVTVGAGGAGTNNTSTPGSAGGTSSFGSFISATGGGGGGVTTNGSNGTGSSGTVRNGTIFTTFYFFPGTDTRPNGASATAALTWSASLVHHPGACGSGETVDVVGENDASGGVGGVVYLEWVG